MTPAQRARRIRALHDRRAKLAAELRALDMELSPLEQEESKSLGFFFGGTLKGKRLLDAMDGRDHRGRFVGRAR